MTRSLSRLHGCAAVIALTVILPVHASGQEIFRLIVEIKTSDKTFAGTDDPIQLQIGGQAFNLDNPNHDDFERNNTDHFELPVNGGLLSVELIKAIGIISVAKLGDSFWGGGWAFGGIKVWVNDTTGAPIYENPNVNVWLDGDSLVWSASLQDAGWNFPPPPPEFPPCTIGDVDTGLLFDSDCDGIPDESDPVFNPTDTDGDGLPDGYEVQTGTDPHNPDTDGDGWWDGRNRRSFLVLTRIRCLDEQEDIGRDELYLTAEDVRFPVTESLDGNWPMDDGSDISPGVIVDSRVSPPVASGVPPLDFRTRFRLRESDFTIFEHPTDDTLKDFDINWNGEGTFQIEHNDGDAHYILDFVSFTLTFRDPNPLDANADTERYPNPLHPENDLHGDGLTERKEFQISMQDPAVQHTPIAGYNGLADPSRRDAFVEVDAVGSDNQVPYDAKQMVVSQFYNHGISLRFDDGYLGGGQVLPYEETLTMPKLLSNYKGDPTRFAPERASYFRYGLFVDKAEGEGCFGIGSLSPPPGGGNFIVAHFRAGCFWPDLGHTMIGEYAPIVIMHEMGHTFGFCHRVGDKDPQAPSSCSAPSGTCAHYCTDPSTNTVDPTTPIVDQSSTTAMGSDTTWDLITEILFPWGLVGIGAGIVVGGLIGGIPGAIIGGIIGGLLGSLFGATQADAFARSVNYHLVEWTVMRFF